MPNPFATQAPLSGTAAPPKPRNPFASSAPLASGANATIGAQPGAGAGVPASDRAARAHHPGPPPTAPPTAAYAPTAPPPTFAAASPHAAAYPGATAPHAAAYPGAAPPAAHHQQHHHPPPAYDPPAPSPLSSGTHGYPGYAAPHAAAGAPSPTLFVPAQAHGGPGAAPFGAPFAAAAPAPAPALFVPPQTSLAPSGVSTVAPPSASPSTSSSTPPPPSAPPISLRGRERYCSGGAWVGPAPEWPRPPADATLESADASRVAPRHAVIAREIRAKHAALVARCEEQGAAGANTSARRKELDGLSQKLGGLLAFLGLEEGDERKVTGAVADALATLCEAMRAGDRATVDAHLLWISTNHWEEAAYWFPALKRLTKL